jgi:hypothetical protein
MNKARGVVTLYLLGAVLVPGALKAEVIDEVARLRAELEAVKKELAEAKAGSLPEAQLDVARFDGTWAGEISKDERNNCGAGEIKFVVRAGKVEGTRWKYGTPAPAKGVIEPNGSFEGYTNRAVFVGKFDGDTFSGYWPKNGCANQVATMKRIAP